jgi:hypothetical protein
MSVYVDEVAVVMAISKIMNMEGNVTVRSIITQGSFRGKRDSIKSSVQTLLTGWEDSKWMASKAGRGGGKVYTITSDGWKELQKIRTQKAPWLSEAEELVVQYGELLSDVDWEQLLEKAASKEAHRSWFQKMYLPWLQQDNFWLLDTSCPDGMSINRQGVTEKKYPSCGLH